MVKDLTSAISEVFPTCMVLRSGKVVAASKGLNLHGSLPMPVKELGNFFSALPENIRKDIQEGTVTATYPYVWRCGTCNDNILSALSNNVILPVRLGEGDAFLVLSHDGVSRKVLSSLPVVGMYTSASNPFDIHFVSRAIEQWTGLPPEKFTGDESLFRLMIHPEDRSRVAQEFRAVGPGTTTFSVAYRLTHKDGPVTWVRQDLITNGLGSVDDRHLFMLSDITEWKERQLALSQAEERYRLFFQRGPLAIMCIDRLGFIIDCNERLAHLAGRSREEVIGLNALSSKHAALRDYAREVLRGRDVRYQGEYTIPGNGKKIIISVTAFPLRNEEGSVVGGYAFIEDVSNRAELKRRLDKERDFNRLTIETAGILVAEVLGDGTIVRINKIIGKLLGVDEKECKDKIFWDLFVAPGRRKAFVESFENTISTGRTTSIESEISCGKDEKRQIAWKISLCPCFLSTKRPEQTHLIIVGTDISSQRKLEEQIREIQKMDAIGRLAGGVAHDFNNQLTAILGYCQMLLMDVDPSSTTCQQLKVIEKAAKRAADTTSQLLAFSRKQALQPKRVLLNQAVKDSSRLFERLLGENIHVEFQFAPEDIVVEVDPGRFQQVLLNLALNARDAMDEGGKITIRTYLKRGGDLQETALSYKKMYAGIEVSDTGSGMEPEVLEKAFEPFFSTKPPGQGTGLGLAMVYGTIKQSGGHVYIESSPGRGTKVNILLPIFQKDSSIEASSELEGPDLEIEPGQLVMVVEDEELVKKTVSDYLKRLGFEVVLFSTAEDALSYLRDKDSAIPSILITDVVMPGTSGLVLAEEIRRFVPEMPVLFMSGYSPEVIEKQGILPETIPFLSKPFTISDLSRALKQVLSSS